ncbi:MAG: hypothetical protein EOP49_12225 [Sphingobacteriales bacterium]|nr:MAG: hypothetical protein EOP49_12225 [Sphingobacteriales bacterium]
MRRRSISLLVISVAAIIWFAWPETHSSISQQKSNSKASEASLPPVRDGDIIFHTSSSEQSKAIQLATHSPYSHCGIILYWKGAPYVYEAVQPVKRTPLAAWIKRGNNEQYVVQQISELLLFIFDLFIKP